MVSKIKICGLSDPSAIAAAVTAGADYLGFVFFEPSPRHISYKAAAGLSSEISGTVQKVALTVDADDARLDAIMDSLEPDLLQLHGSESPARVAAIRERFSVPVIKAIKLAGREDLTDIDDYAGVTDMLLFDAKMRRDDADALPGGNGVRFDWGILSGVALDAPFMLSGGLDASNVGDAISQLHPAILDVSSGVETAPGKKSADLIAAFAEAVAKANQQEYAA
jgi:phosphoribosylanthranilate isomerase